MVTARKRRGAMEGRRRDAGRLIAQVAQRVGKSVLVSRFAPAALVRSARCNLNATGNDGVSLSLGADDYRMPYDRRLECQGRTQRTIAPLPDHPRHPLPAKQLPVWDDTTMTPR
jgi:hypothetical protein